MFYCKKAENVKTFEDLGITDARCLGLMGAIDTTPSDLLYYTRLAIRDASLTAESEVFDLMFEKFDLPDEYLSVEVPYFMRVAIPKIVEAGYIRKDSRAYYLTWDEIIVNYGLFDKLDEIDCCSAEVYETAAPLNRDKISEIFETLVEEGVPHIYAEIFYCFMMAHSFPGKTGTDRYHYPEDMFSIDKGHFFEHHLLERSIKYLRELNNATMQKVLKVLIS